MRHKLGGTQSIVRTWLYGLVSHAYICSNLPIACSERTTPRAVPYPAVAREPVLQMVSTLTLSLPRGKYKN